MFLALVLVSLLAPAHSSKAVRGLAESGVSSQCDTQSFKVEEADSRSLQSLPLRVEREFSERLRLIGAREVVGPCGAAFLGANMGQYRVSRTEVFELVNGGEVVARPIERSSFSRDRMSSLGPLYRGSAPTKSTKIHALRQGQVTRALHLGLWRSRGEVAIALFSEREGKFNKPIVIMHGGPEVIDIGYFPKLHTYDGILSVSARRDGVGRVAIFELNTDGWMSHW